MSSRHRSRISLGVACIWLLVAVPLAVHGDDPPADPLAAELRRIELPPIGALDGGAPPAERLADAVRAGLRERGLAAFELGGRRLSEKSWPEYRRERLAALRRSLGNFPAERQPPRVVVAKSQSGDGFAIDNVLYESRPGLWVSANLYRPATPPASAPGLVICPAHHTAKTHGELQDMGMTWARLGCYVLVGDQVGHGERREHPFASDADYAKPFRASRQDYYFRYDLGVQAAWVGESLAGQIAWDLSRGADVLLMQPGIDRQRLAVFGSVAGGGDPAAIAGALDERFSIVAPFNFGGPQPETKYPLPEDAERTFFYTGGGGWESTRNLRDSAADEFAPWLIVGTVAPRRLIYGHEFAWDQPRDPVWKRLERIYASYDASDRLAFAHGRGRLQEQPPAASHCTHIGPVHRVHLHAALAKWWGVADGAAREYSARVDAESLRCWTPELRERLRPRLYRDVLASRAEQLARDPSDATRTAAVRQVFDPAPALGAEDSAPRTVRERTLAARDGAPAVRIVDLATRDERGPRFRLLLPTTEGARKSPAPVVVAVSAAGKDRLLRERADLVAGLLRRGVAVCAVDVHGTGESRQGTGRDRTSAATSYSSSLLMLGPSQLALQRRDLERVREALRGVPEVNVERLGWWGDSPAPPNSADADYKVPHGVDGRPRESEPAGALLALLAGAGTRAPVYARGGVVDFAALLHDHAVYVPHDVLVPGGVAEFGAKTRLAARRDAPTWLADWVDARNRSASVDALREQLGPTAGAATLRLGADSPDAIADWFARSLN